MSDRSHTATQSIGRDLTGNDTDRWNTPDVVFDYASERWGPFDLDSAADDRNTRCENFINEEQDALKTSWRGTNVWCNPPYGTAMHRFVEQAWRQVERGHCKRVVMLLACRTDTRVFHDFIFRYASEIHFVKGRIYFLSDAKHGVEHPANFASVLVVFEKTDQPPKVSVGLWLTDRGRSAKPYGIDANTLDRFFDREAI